MDHDKMNADHLQGELYRLGRKSAANRKAGICDHGWRQGKPGSDTPRDSDIETCLHCGKVATRGELNEERRERLY